MSIVVKDLGVVSAYAYAVEKGYTGTEAEFAELMADYAEVGQRAEDAAESALNSKTAAQTAATTATNKASEATTAAQTATTKAGEAQTSAQTASSKASEASQSASQASGYAQTAETAKTDAQTAKTQAETARDEAVTAKTAAETAQGKAEDAQAAAESVAESIPSDYSQLSEDVSDLKEGLSEVETELNIPADKTMSATSSGSYVLATIGEMTLVNGRTYTFTFSIPSAIGVTIYGYVKDKSNNSNLVQPDIVAGDTQSTRTYKCTTDNQAVKMVFKLGSTAPTTVTAHVTDDAIGTLDSIEAELAKNVRKVSYRYLENLNIEKGYYDNGTFYSNGSYQTVKLACEAGDKFIVDAYYNGAASQSAAQFYDSNMTLLSKTPAITTSGQVNNVKVTAPKNCAYIVFVNYIIADHVDFNICKYINGDYPLFQKNYIALGDSITAIGYGWRPWFNKVTGANEVLCTAVSGATLCDYSDTVVDGNPEATAHSNTISNQVQSILNDPPTEDINFIIISAGTNDHANASEFSGGVTQFVDNSHDYIDIDTVDRTRYDGAMRWIAEKLWSQFPKADIFFATPIQGNEHQRQTWVQLAKCDYMKEVASYLACPVIDATRNSGIYGRYENNGTEGKYLYDGLHPNMYGRKKIGLYYAASVIDYYSHEID